MTNKKNTTPFTGKSAEHFSFRVVYPQNSANNDTVFNSFTYGYYLLVKR